MFELKTLQKEFYPRYRKTVTEILTDEYTEYDPLAKGGVVVYRNGIRVHPTETFDHDSHAVSYDTCRWSYYLLEYSALSEDEAIKMLTSAPLEPVKDVFPDHPFFKNLPDDEEVTLANFMSYSEDNSVTFEFDGEVIAAEELNERFYDFMYEYESLCHRIQDEELRLFYVEWNDVGEHQQWSATEYFATPYPIELIQDNYIDAPINPDDDHIYEWNSVTVRNPIRGGGFSCMN